MSLTATNALISLKDGSAAPVNLAPGVIGVFTPGNELVFALQSTVGIQRAEMTLLCPKFPGLHQLTWSWQPGQYNGWQITFPENTLANDDSVLAGMSIVITVTDSSSSSAQQSYYLQSNLDALGIGGARTAIVDFNGAVGDGLVTANHATDYTRLTLANEANMALGFIPTGIALTRPIAGFPVVYAPPGTEVPAAIMSLTPDGTTSWGILDANGRVTRKRNPTSADVFIGVINQQANLLVLQTPFESANIDVGLPPYSVDTAGSAVSNSALIEQAIVDADIAGSGMQLNFAGKPVLIPQGLMFCERPIHVKTRGVTIRGEGRLTSHLRTTTYVGPTFHVAPDIGAFPTVPNTGIGGGNAAVIKHEAQVTNEHWFEISECGAGGDYHGLSTISVEMIVTPSATTTTQSALLWASFGERLLTDGSDNEAIGIGYSGSAGAIEINSFYFTLTTTTGTTTIFAASNSSLIGTQYTLQCVYNGATMKIYINGVQQATAAKTGTIVQGSWETVNFNGQYQYFMGIRKYTSADALIASFRVSANARAPAAAVAKFTEDANTICLINFDTFVGVFIKARARNTKFATSCLDAYYIHRLDNVVTVGGMVDVKIENMCITNIYGTALNCNSAFNMRVQDMTIVAKNGLRMDNNCFKTALRDLFITSSNNDAAGNNARVGISYVNAGNVVSAGNIYVSGFDTNLVLVGAGDFGTWGSWYSTSTKAHILVQGAVNINWVAESEISDEGSVGSKVPDFFLAILSTHQTYWANFQPSQGGSAGYCPIVIIQGDSVFGPGNHVFDVPWLKVDNANAGIFQFLDTASTFNVAVRYPFIFPAGTAPVIRPTPSIPAGVRMFMTPRGDKDMHTITMTDANRTVSAEEWLYFTNVVSGTLTATRTLTTPRANVGPRVVVNTTAQTLSVVASGSASPILLATGKTGTFLSDGTNLTLIATT